MASVVMPYTTQTVGIETGNNEQFYRIRDIEQKIMELNKDDGVFYKVLTMLPAMDPATQAKYEWSEDDVPAVTTKINFAAGYSAAATTFVVDDALGLIKNSLIYLAETRELMYVTAVPSATSITVVRGFRGSVPAPIAHTDTVLFLGDQLPETAVANVNNGSIPVPKFNYIQRWSKGVTISDMQDNVMMMDGVGQMPREVLRKALEMKRQINATLIRGRKGMGVSPALSTDGFVYTTDGFESYITSNVLDLGSSNGNLSWEVLNGFLNPQFTATSSSPTKMLLCGEALFSAITKISWDRFDPVVFNPILGATLKRIATDQGGLVDVVLDKYGFPFGSGLSGEGIVVDLTHVGLKEFIGQPLTWRPNVHANDAHVRQDELWGTASLMLAHESTMGRIVGGVAEFQ